jgi:hypothetical protein
LLNSFAGPKPFWRPPRRGGTCPVIPHRPPINGVSMAKRLARIYASGFCLKRKNTALIARNVQLQSKADITTFGSCLIDRQDFRYTSATRRNQGNRNGMRSVSPCCTTTQASTQTDDLRNALMECQIFVGVRSRQLSSGKREASGENMMTNVARLLMCQSRNLTTAKHRVAPGALADPTPAHKNHASYRYAQVP